MSGTGSAAEFVEIEVFVEFGLQEVADIVEVGRAQWEAMSPGERDDFCVQAAVDLQNNTAPCGWRLLGPDA